MLSLNKTEPAFDMEKEVMCLLPKLPRRAEMDSICNDLQISRESLNNHLRSIARRHRVDYMPGTDDMAVGIPRLSWPGLDKEATKYYENLYERTDFNGI